MGIFVRMCPEKITKMGRHTLNLVTPFSELYTWTELKGGRLDEYPFSFLDFQSTLLTVQDVATATSSTTDYISLDNEIALDHVFLAPLCCPLVEYLVTSTRKVTHATSHPSWEVLSGWICHLMFKIGTQEHFPQGQEQSRNGWPAWRTNPLWTQMGGTKHFSLYRKRSTWKQLDPQWDLLAIS